MLMSRLPTTVSCAPLALPSTPICIEKRKIIFNLCIFVLSVFVFCSPYFQRIFCETPCKHPVIVLNDLKGWEVQAIVDFMYKGVISVDQEQVASLLNAAESLQVG